LTLAAGLLASSSSRTAVSSSLWPRWASPKRRSANYARSSGSQADPLPARLSERRSMPGRLTSALSKVETDSALEGLRTKDARRARSPFDARPCPGERCGWHTGTGPAQVLPETARRGDDRQTFRHRDGWTDERRPDLLVRAFGGRVSATRQKPVSSRAIWSRLWLRTWTASVIIHVVDAECGGRLGGGRRVSTGLFGLSAAFADTSCQPSTR
jgi:hypothetical protein